MVQERIVVGVAGGSASGKTTLVSHLAKAFEGRIAVLHHDDYYRDLSHLPFEARAATDFERLEAIETELMLEHLTALRRGEAVQTPVYDFATHTRLPIGKPLSSGPVIIVDGLMVLAEPLLNDAFDLRVFVDIDDDTRFIRRLTRDMTERGRTLESVVRQYESSVKPFQDTQVAASKRKADLIVPSADFERLSQRLARLVAGLMGNEIGND